jgi:PAS domain S-box-containing protein
LPLSIAQDWGCVSGILTHPDDGEQNDRAYKALFAGESDSLRMEKRYQNKEGEVTWADVTVSIVRDADGRPLGTFGQSQDVIERKRTEEALRESEERFRAGFEHAEA